MPDTDPRTDFLRRATKVRELVDGIFDKTDRRYIRKFVADAEKLAAVAPPQTLITALSHSGPKN
jgi:hypothetical protein